MPNIFELAQIYEDEKIALESEIQKLQNKIDSLHYEISELDYHSSVNSTNQKEEIERLQKENTNIKKVFDEINVKFRSTLYKIEKLEKENQELKDKLNYNSNKELLKALESQDTK